MAQDNRKPSSRGGSSSRKPSGSSKYGSSGGRGGSSGGRGGSSGGRGGSSGGRGSSSGGRGGSSGSRSGSKDSSHPSSSGRGSSSGSGGPRKPKKQYSATTRDVTQAEYAEYAEKQKRRRDLQGAAVNLPNWVIEGVARVTPKDRVALTLEALGAASEALADGNFQSAIRHGNRAKSLSPSDATIRETIGIAAYRLGDWKTALTELRAYRRIAGETTHLPIEMDVLRAQGRSKDVEAAWQELQKRRGHGLVMNEGKIVYASYLIDEGRADEAWQIVSVNPARLEQDPNEGHLRLYYVAARAAAARGDRGMARRLSDAIILNDPSFPGYEQLESEIAAIPPGE